MLVLVSHAYTIEMISQYIIVAVNAILQILKRIQNTLLICMLNQKWRNGARIVTQRWALTRRLR